MNVDTINPSNVSAFGDVHYAQLLTGSSRRTEQQKDESLFPFVRSLESQLTSRSLEINAKKTVVPPLLQNAAARLTGAAKLRVKATCTSGTVKRSTYFSRSSPSQLHPTSSDVIPEDHPKRNIDLLDKPDDSSLTIIPDTQNFEGVEIENHIQCFDDVTDCLDVDKVLQNNVFLSYSCFAKDGLCMRCLCEVDDCSDFGIGLVVCIFMQVDIKCKE